MPQDIKIWEINSDDKLREVNKEKLELEQRLEKWLEKDISTISNDLLVIGRQIETDFGGIIDLLCLDQNGDLVIVELKRDKTPREITAQVIDYASWVDDLSNEKTNEIADGYLGDRGPLGRAFQEKFDSELPEILNEHHKMLIVASEIDDSSERIVEYLSNSYGVNINVATFQYFKDGGKEFLARVFLIEPSEADYRTQTKSSTKRKPPLSYEEFKEIANNNGVGVLYSKMFNEMEKYTDITQTTRSNVAFIGSVGKEKSRKTVFNILPGESSSKKGLYCEIKVSRFIEYFKIDLSLIRESFPIYEEDREGDDAKYIGGYFKNEEQIDKFISLLRKNKIN